MKEWFDVFNRTVMGIEIYQLGAAFVILLTALISKKLFDRYIVKLLEKLALKTKFKYDNMTVESLHPPVSALILTVGIFYALLALKFPTEPYDFPQFFRIAFKIAVSILVIWALYRLSNVLAAALKNYFSKIGDEYAIHFAPLIGQSIRITVLILGALLIVQNLGYSVGSLLAGLGIGGLAVALAAKDTIANLFGTLIMVLDKPFKIGDWVRFRDIDGNVEAIGFRSTKVRTWSKSLKIVPNQLLTSEIIENWSAMPKRRVKMRIGVTYDSKPDKLKKLRDRMERILEKDPGVDKDYYLVYFTDFGPSALEFFIYYFTYSTVWKEYLEVRQRINVKFIEALEELGLSFAFPSQTVYFGDSLKMLEESGEPN